MKALTQSLCLKVMKMAFERVETLDEDDFYKSLVKQAQKVSIIDIGKLYESDDKENQAYFYIKYMLASNGQEQSVAYNVKYIDDIIIVPEGAKLYPLLSFVSGIEDGEIHCNKQDIDDALKDLSFKARAKKQKGKTTWYKIIPIEEISVE